MPIIEDINYIKRTLNGDTSAFSVLVERYQLMVFTLVIKIIRHREDAEDVAQDVFVKAFSSLNKFRHESLFSTWLCRIAYTTAVSYIRKQRPGRAGKEIEVDPVDETYMNQSEDLRDERLQKLQNLVEKLPSDDAILISLYYQYSHSIEEIAKITGISISNIKVRLYRIRKKLYQEIKENE